MSFLAYLIGALESSYLSTSSGALHRYLTEYCLCYITKGYEYHTSNCAISKISEQAGRWLAIAPRKLGFSHPVTAAGAGQQWPAEPNAPAQFVMLHHTMRGDNNVPRPKEHIRTSGPVEFVMRSDQVIYSEPPERLCEGMSSCQYPSTIECRYRRIRMI